MILILLIPSTSFYNDNKDIFDIVGYILIPIYIITGSIIGIIYKIPLFRKWKWFAVSDNDYDIMDTYSNSIAIILSSIIFIIIKVQTL